MRSEVIFLLLGMTLVTYIPRALPAALSEKMKFSPRVEKFLKLIPYTAMAAIIFPGILTADAANPAYGLAGGAAALTHAVHEDGPGGRGFAAGVDDRDFPIRERESPLHGSDALPGDHWRIVRWYNILAGMLVELLAVDFLNDLHDFKGHVIRLNIVSAAHGTHSFSP